ncbi:2'-5' RNA ligase family protein [Acuticoccus sp. MNP-M23]|uniref:2'-5' RNA ligase family protein n=1 Tax=Acuticoccus sp. MNP-M23 TaxID=3072793 RepID=UPI002814C868|nr:2'-5' RNA ligase family protein [Acuticoccus sp. MNP-M23]WMS42266.1 2'-5' RNA ligase family protein [Acuticoccus sp. MNP-M23]
MADPIILTVQFDAASASFFETARRTHFPPALNKIPAHLTLFHALPGDDETRILEAVAAAANRAPFKVAVDGLMPLGRGVAYRIASESLASVRRTLADAFADDLTRQDRERFRPHVTIQNKVTPETACATLAALSDGFRPFTATAEGLQLWWYRGGPWDPLAAVSFSG